MNQSTLWFEINRELVAKSISELMFEGVLSAESNGDVYTLKTESAKWSFKGQMGIWETVKVIPQSLTRNNNEVFEASEFFLDIQNETGMNDIILGNFFEEMHNTLLADLSIKKAFKNLTVSEIAGWDGEKIQRVLKGHPKILLSKGRVGWHASHREQYSPEAFGNFQLFWIAVQKNLLTRPFDDSLLDESFDSIEWVKLNDTMASHGVSHETHDLMPVHPWQWDRYIETQFIGEISKGQIVPLGPLGDCYLPQTSIRTLSNASRPHKMDIKLPVSILNTSCVRGLPSHYVEMGEKLSTSLSEVCLRDEKLKMVRIQKEKGGLNFNHPAFHKIKDAPYRYHEVLGALWRESAQSKLASDEKAILTAALFHQDETGNSLIAEFIRLSGKSAEEWLTAFFKMTLVPLLHFQVNYGVGFVAHGQNIVLILKNNFPAGMILKDFHGDMRLSSEMPEAGIKAFGQFSELTKLPPHYLIHDLITGNLITVQRFISLVVKETLSIPEEKYYELMYQVIKNEPAAHLLLRDEFERLLVNKVRFTIGYADTSERPLAQLGKALKNPLARFKGNQ